MAGCEISTVYAAISGAHVRGLNSHGIVAVKDKEVREADIARVIEQAKAVAIPMDREVLHVLPQQYVVDDQDGIRDPLGMAGVRLEAKVHIVTTAVASAQNVIKCANRCNLQVADIVLESLASSQAVLEDDEKELGVALIDIGGGTCDLMVYCRRRDRAHLGAAARRRPHHERHRDGAAHAARLAPRRSSASTAARGAVTSRTARRWRSRRSAAAVRASLPRIELVEVIEPRVEEIFEHVKKELMRSGYYDSLAAVVLTGGATAMDGVRGRAGARPADRRGVPTKIGGLVDVVRSPATRPASAS